MNIHKTLARLTLGAVAALVAGLAAAQPGARTPAMAAVEAARTADLQNHPLRARVEVLDDARSARTVIGLYSVPLSGGAGAPARVWRARRTMARYDRVSVSFADERTCPPLKDLVQTSEWLQAPTPGLWNAGSDAEPGITLDAPTYVFAAPRADYPLPAQAALEITADASSTMAAWLRLGLAAMEGCWSPGSPAPPTSR